LNVIDNVDTLIEPTPDKIIYYFDEYHPMFDKYSHVDFRQGVPKSGKGIAVCETLPHRYGKSLTNMITQCYLPPGRGNFPEIEIEDIRDALVILDDMMIEADQKILNIVLCESHHREISVIFFVQNFFNNNRYMCTLSLNAQYIVLFKNSRDSSQFAHLARQLYPHTSRFAVEAYKNATTEPYCYLLVDLRSEQDEDLRLRTRIFPGSYPYFRRRVVT